MKKGRNIWKHMLLGVLGIVLFMVVPLTVDAETLRDSAAAGHGVTFSPDGEGWTMDVGVKEVESISLGTVISSGRESSIEEIEEWQHLYYYKRRGEVPVGQWKVTMTQGYCCHNLGEERYATLRDDFYLGLNLKEEEYICENYYMPGWTALCADCKEPILANGELGFQKAFYLYGSKASVSHIDSLDVSLDYYYLCPFCSHIEQGASKRYHDCKKVSTNRYRVVYLLRQEDVDAGAGGKMLPSIHMYNNDTAYEGDHVIPQTTLHPNTFTYPGHVVKEWVWTTLNEDGTYTVDTSDPARVFEPEAEIYNLITENWKDETSCGGTVYLTAVWEEASSVLEINANGGKYRGQEGITPIEQDYGTAYTVDTDALTPPKGYKVKFVLSGGKLPGGGTSMTTDRSFVGFAKGDNFQGLWNSRGNIYGFVAPNNHTDTLIAKWSEGSVILPTPEKEGYGFGGWYGGVGGENYIGTGGDAYTPTKNITLYARWVDITLVSTDNYTDNGGRGAVDLRWFEGDASLGSNKTYLIYQRKEDGDWIQINSRNKAEAVGISEKFTYNGVVNQTYTIPYSGVYTLTAAGAQGASSSLCDDKVGGKGGKVTARVWLKEGDVLTYTCGGQGGFNGGGSATNYGSGGGYTIIRSEEKGLLMIAGGGGGATPGKDGGEGGYEAAALGSSYKGLNGTAGGGGGATAGAAGNYEKHEHDEDCILIENRDYSLFESGWWSDYQSTVTLPVLWYGRRDNEAEGTVTSDLKNTHTDSMTYTTVSGHTGGGSGVAALRLELGTAYGSGRNKTVPSFADGYIPVMGNTSVSFDFSFNTWGDMIYDQHCTKDKNRMRIYNQNNELIYDKHLSEYECNIVDRTEFYYTDVTYYIRDTISIPEGTTSIYFSCFIEDFPNANRWLTLKANGITFQGGRRESIICGYEDGQILSNGASGGGGSFVNKSAVLSYSITPAGNTGNGHVSVASELVGFVDELFLKAVPAPDEAAPEGVRKTDVTVKESGPATVEVAWPSITELSDRKTTYEHKVAAYNMGSDMGAAFVTSNVTRNNLGRIKGYYVTVDTKSNTTLEKGTLQTGNSVTVQLTDRTQYLHIAVVDIGGNVSPTTHIDLGSVEEQGELPVCWPLTTEQLQISAQEGLYQREQNTYFVKADGATAFVLHYQARMEGPARADYQINYGILNLTSGSLKGRDVTIVKNSGMAAAVTVPNSDISQVFSGDRLLQENQYVEASRTNHNTHITIHKRFVVGASMDGKLITVLPQAGADGKEGVIYSEQTADALHALYLIGDGSAPDIGGLEELRQQGLAEFDEEGYFCHTLTATDTGSGVRDFYAVLINKDSGLNRVVTSLDKETLTLKLAEDDGILAGDTEITIYAVDRVGNVRTEQVDIASFSLMVTAERILAPHEPVFQAGESGILRIHTYGYVSRIEVEYPIQWNSYVKDRVVRYDYGDTSARFKEEILQFTVPLELEEEAEYCFTVKAYKGEHMLNARPEVATIYVKGSVLDELRTRLR